MESNTKRMAMIVAAGLNNEIGKDNQLLWHLPDDFKWFKKQTMGYPVVMGRKTFESIGKPLPGRLNIVLSKTATQIEGVEVFTNFEDTLKIIPASLDKVFVIGGGSLYNQLLPACSEVYMTRVMSSFEADTFFPVLAPTEWKKVYSFYHPQDEKHSHAFEFEIYHRI
jgi:dihydrofolate reductase